MYCPIKIMNIPGIMHMKPIKAYPLGISCTLIISTIITEMIGSKSPAREGNRVSGKRLEINAYDKNIPHPKKTHNEKKLIK